MRRVALGELCDVKGGKRLPKGEVYADSRTKHPYLRVCDFERGSIAERDLKYISEDTHQKISRYTIASDDVFISIAGTIGLVGLVPEHLSGANLTENAAKLRIRDSSVLDRRYLAKYLSTEGQADISVRKRSVGQPKLALFRIAEIPIPLPPLAEQKRIAGILDAADALRVKRRESLAQLDTFLQSTFLDMFGDPVTNPMGWEVVAFQEIGEFASGATPSKAREDYWVGRTPWVSPKDMKVSQILDSQDHVNESAFVETNLKLLEPGHLLIVVRGMILAHSFPVAINRVPVAINQDMKAISPSSNFNVDFLMECVRHLKRQILAEVSTAGHGTKRFDAEAMKKVQVPLPPLDLQHRFAAIVESVEQQKASQRAHLDGLDTLFASLQSRAFAGELT